MYYVNQEQIDQRLDLIPTLQQTAIQLLQEWEAENRIQWFAQERLLHLAIEIVTDVGSSLIDAFIMRDASSYEDIMEIIYEEKVISESSFRSLKELVRWRKSLVQSYYELEHGEIHPLLPAIAEVLPVFAQEVRQYIKENRLS